MREEEQRIGDYTKTKSVSNEIRSSLIQLIEKLVEIKEYRMDTLFLAVNLVDRYLSSVNPSKRISCVGSIAVCCLLIAAKLEEPKNPSFNNMCKLLEKLEVVKVKKNTICIIESQILLELDLTVRNVVPISFLERYLRLYGMD